MPSCVPIVSSRQEHSFCREAHIRIRSEKVSAADRASSDVFLRRIPRGDSSAAEGRPAPDLAWRYRLATVVERSSRTCLPVLTTVKIHFLGGVLRPNGRVRDRSGS
ncbi:hypothetical protein Adu01nite_94120 [Paractinoplanes durhamensis]|uniref:Uncharacterized protein n=1 Tax=Paractinoplanes durhamensis TaxID=113563 RepID=A0ABQ3ZE26_9ACTN|nr:hypothetical protein Adu01nite_94120 [Actinoplanes durhamensis]